MLHEAEAVFASMATEHDITLVSGDPALRPEGGVSDQGDADGAMLSGCRARPRMREAGGCPDRG